ncbi:hypothetical protein M3Y95_00357100 [Aphelenchoides besseyi]|nr:hypothetical protein M3Y95_00357100 [Aphelenchoides besseyi]
MSGVPVSEDVSAVHVTSGSKVVEPPEEQTCICLPMRLGVIVIALISVLLGLGGLAESIAGFTKTDWTNWDEDDEESENAKEWKWSKVCLIVYFLTSSLFVVVSILLLVGAFMKRAWLLWPYIVYSIIQIITSIGLIIACIFVLATRSDEIEKRQKSDRVFIYTAIGIALCLLSVCAALTAFFSWVIWKARIVIERRQEECAAN